ncbi:MAG: glutamate mutase L [Anaerolineales bacterium]|jgi:hypothetical protein
MSANIEPDTLLAIDVGSVHTRASLFDVVEGRYRLVASGRALSTAGPPLFDVREGVRIALDQLQAVTGRKMIDDTETLIMPVTGGGMGVDICVATGSAGPTLKAVLVGLMDDISLESGRRLAESTYLTLIEEIGLTDRRGEDEKLDSILRAKPDVLLVVGGTDGGAAASVLSMVDLVSLSTGLMPDGNRPHVVFAGNRTLAAHVAERFTEATPVALTANIRPDLEQEDLAPARTRLAEVLSESRASKVAGYDELVQWSGGHMMQTADAFGRVIRYLSQVYDPAKGVLGIDLGGSHTTLAAGFSGDLRLSVRSDMGLGESLPGLIQHTKLESISRWLPEEISDADILNYVHNKANYPATIPAEKDELYLEFALAREIMRSSLKLARRGWPRKGKLRDSILLPPMEPILAAGGILARAPHPGYAALAILDAFQPVGITTLVLDPHGLTPALGVAAGPAPMVSVQVLNSGNYVSLGTVVSPVGGGKLGRPALRVRLDKESEGEGMEGEVRAGQLVILPLGLGETGRLTLRPEKGFDVGFGGPGKAGALRVSGGILGLIIDARGRPLPLPLDPEARRELASKWLWDIGVRE